MAEGELRGKLGWLIGIRVAVVTLLLGSALLVAITAPGSFEVRPIFFLIGITYGLSIVWALTLGWAERMRWLVDLQLAGDALVISAFIYYTGGATSYFSTLFVLPIIAAATIQFRRGGLLLAVFSTLLYSAIVLAQYLDQAGLLEEWMAVRPAILPPFRVAQYTVGINVFGFFAVALLSGSLAESLRRAGASLERASTEIADLQAFSRHVIDSLTSGLVTTDYAGRITSVNRAAEVITGYTAAALVDRRIEEVMAFPPDLAVSIDADLRGARSRRLEYRFRRPDGAEIDIGLSTTHLHVPGGRAGLLFTFQDVTDFKRLERDARLKQRLAAVGEMAAGIAHEIRNPLASMSGSIQILRQELPLSEEQAQLMDIVLRESERLNETIRSFLAYARPQRFEVARLDVRRVLNDTALLLRNSSEVREGHLVEVDVPASEVSFEADEGQIRQIVWNLATNGLRAMKDGGRLRLIARTEGDAGGGGAVVIEVADEGVGIPAEDLDGIFQPFHGNFTRGTGLGLAIVHRIVSDYNGEIHVSSTPGAGTTVSVRLPVRAAAAA